MTTPPEQLPLPFWWRKGEPKRKPPSWTREPQAKLLKATPETARGPGELTRMARGLGPQPKPSPVRRSPPTPPAPRSSPPPRQAQQRKRTPPKLSPV